MQLDIYWYTSCLRNLVEVNIASEREKKGVSIGEEKGEVKLASQ